MYKRITRLDPQNESVSFKLADLYSKQGLTIEAKQIYLELAEEYKRQNNQKKALGIYKKILEFDRSNIKMRILLADNYLREGMKEEAVGEYLTASDILIKKKEFPQAEELLMQTYGKVKHLKIFEKLISCYITQGNNNKAIQMLRNLGDEIFKHLNLLKILGELYFKNNLIEEAEQIYKKHRRDRFQRDRSDHETGQGLPAAGRDRQGLPAVPADHRPLHRKGKVRRGQFAAALHHHLEQHLPAGTEQAGRDIQGDQEDQQPDRPLRIAAADLRAEGHEVRVDRRSEGADRALGRAVRLPGAAGPADRGTGGRGGGEQAGTGIHRFSVEQCRPGPEEATISKRRSTC